MWSLNPRVETEPESRPKFCTWWLTATSGGPPNSTSHTTATSVEPDITSKTESGPYPLVSNSERNNLLIVDPRHAPIPAVAV